jgi:ABC-2 type transport system ATP-binding protein
LYQLPINVVEDQGMAQLQRFGLGGREDDLLGNFSHGMRQRVLLASAFMRNPRVLLVDEPMVGLDPQGMRLVKVALREAATSGAMVIMSTHTLDIVEQVCDRVVVIGNGKLIADGTVAELLNRVGSPERTLEDVFLMLTGADQEGAQL